jgi:hypothetical protein
MKKMIIKYKKIKNFKEILNRFKNFIKEDFEYNKIIKKDIIFLKIFKSITKFEWKKVIGILYNKKLNIYRNEIELKEKKFLYSIKLENLNLNSNFEGIYLNINKNIIIKKINNIIILKKKKLLLL